MIRRERSAGIAVQDAGEAFHRRGAIGLQDEAMEFQTRQPGSRVWLATVLGAWLALSGTGVAATPDVLPGRDGWLYPGWTRPVGDHRQDTLQAVDLVGRAQGELTRRGLRLVVVLIPAKARAQAINNFLVNDLLGQADPERNPAGADVTVRQLLDRAAKTVAVADSVAIEPSVKGAVRSTIGNVYLELGLYQEAVEQLSSAMELLSQAGAPLEDVFFELTEPGAHRG